MGDERIEIKTINDHRYASNYHGHLSHHLEAVYAGLKAQGHKSIIYLAGDSSLDNKYWVTGFREARNGYENIIKPSMLKPDICFHLNDGCQQRASKNKECETMCAINTAVEATTLSDRSNRLLPQDKFIRDHITENDYLIVSVGGNDIALRPSCCTICNMCCLVGPGCWPCCWCFCQTTSRIKSGKAIGLKHFIHMFKIKGLDYVNRLIEKKKPKKVLICMIYFPDEVSGGSWADPALCCLGYDCCPTKLQAVITTVFDSATNTLTLDGTECVPFPLYKILDGKNTKDFVQRVEPSIQGGKKMADAFLKTILEE